MLNVLAPLLLLANGLAAGVMLGTQLGGFPYMASLPVNRYVYAHAFLGQRYDPTMPICLIGTVVLDAVLAITAPDPTAQILFAVAGFLAATTPVIAVVKNAPVNRWMRTLDPDDLPADFKDPRPEWGAWNSRRSWITLLALAVNCTALGFLL
ncbi:anthrone oxygenase family protein [Streptomyces fradiae]|uniref:anthrone oxygenase family protein n=1 Tax=Streptomyces fradiae TaxID=1906 RepID=UPI0035199739